MENQPTPEHQLQPLAPLSSFHRFLRLLSLTSFNLLLMVFCALLLFVIPQTKDIVLQVNVLDNLLHFVGFMLSLCWFSLVAWWSARYLINIAFHSTRYTLLNADNQPKQRYPVEFDYGGKLGTWIPRGYALVPPLLVLVAGFNQGLYKVAIGAAVLAAIVLWLLVRRTQWQKGRKDGWWSATRWGWLVAGLFTLVLVLALAFTLSLGKTLGAFFIIFWGLGSIAWFFTLLAQRIGYWVNKVFSLIPWLGSEFIKPPYPVTWVLLLALFVSWLIPTDNHEVRRIPSPNAGQPAFASIDEAWSDFVQRPKPLSVQQDKQALIPVFFVLSQGGGLRGSYWTALVLSELEEQIPGFHQHLFGLAGASGGTVGNVFFAAALQQHQREPDLLLQQTLLEAVGQDYLSGVSTSFLFNDMLNRFAPNGLFGPDRASYLEQDWQRGFEEAFGTSGLDQGLHSFYQPYRSQPNVWMPLLLSMGTLQEAGSRVITAPFPIEQKVFPDKYDVYQLMGCSNGKQINCDMRLSTVGLNSARFPYITPAGTLKQEEEYQDKRHILDGGYYDNYGAQSTLDMLQYLTPKMGKGADAQYLPVLIIIANDQALNKPDALAYFDPKRAQPLASNSFAFNELTAPPQGLFNLYPGHTKTHIADLLSYQNAHSQKTLVIDKAPLSETQLTNALVFDLKYHPQVQVPLGWWLSDKVKCYMQGQTQAQGQEYGEECDELGTLKRNGRIFQLVSKLKQGLNSASSENQ